MEPSFPTVSPEGYRRSVVLRIFWLLAGVAVVAGLVGVNISRIQELWSTLMISSEAHTQVFLGTQEGSTTLYTPAAGSFQKVAVEGDRVAWDARSGGRAYVQHDEAGYHLFFDGRRLVTQEAPMVSVAVSEDKSMIAYSESTSGSYTDFVDLREWRTILYFPATQRSIVIGTGAGPHFLDNHRVLYLSPQGVHVVDLAVGATTLVLPQTYIRVHPTLLVSPNGTQIGIRAIDASSNFIRIFALSDASVTQVMELAPSRTAISYKLGNDVLYSIETTQFGTALYGQEIGSETTRRLAWFPRHFAITDLYETHE